MKPSIPTFKCMLVGPSVGKTTWLRKFLPIESTPYMGPTFGVEVSPLHFVTTNPKNKAHILFNIWEVGNTHKGLDIEGYSVGANCFLIFARSREEALPFVDQIPKDMPFLVINGDPRFDPFTHLARLLLQDKTLTLA